MEKAKEISCYQFLRCYLSIKILRGWSMSNDWLITQKQGLNSLIQHWQQGTGTCPTAHRNQLDALEGPAWCVLRCHPAKLQMLNWDKKDEVNTREWLEKFNQFSRHTVYWVWWLFNLHWQYPELWQFADTSKQCLLSEDVIILFIFPHKKILILKGEISY